MTSRGGLDVLMVDAARHSKISLAVAHCVARIPDVRLHVLAQRRLGPFSWSTLRESVTLADIEADAAWLAAVERVVAERDIDVVFSVTEPGGRFLAANRERLESAVAVAPVPSVEMFDLATNKGRVTAFATLHGITVPRTLPVTAAALADGTLGEELAGFSMPVLLKRTTLSAGKGITRHADADGLIAHLGNLQAIEPDTLIIQEIVEGDDICCSVLCGSGGEVVAHSTFQGFGDSEGRFSPWSRMYFSENQEALARVEVLTRLLDWQGPANLDFIRTAQGEYVFLEFNGRFDGEILGSLVAGVNFAALQLQQACGGPVEQPPYHPGPFLTVRGVVETGSAMLRRESGDRIRLRQTVLPLVIRHPVSEVMRILTDRFRRR